MRKPIVAGNWKMNGDLAFVEQMAGALNDFQQQIEELDVIIAPPSLYMQQLNSLASAYQVSAQNVHHEAKGAKTGEISIAMLKDIQCGYSLVGHSERREFFGETDESVSLKVAALVNNQVVPILCIGETLEERKADRAFDVVKDQLLQGIKKIKATGDNLIVAYEPVWAIGTGETATPEQAQEIHSFIRSVLSAEISAEQAQKVRILYGGSVSAQTAKELFSQQDIDGGLVGGASLKIEDFKSICSAAVNK